MISDCIIITCCFVSILFTNLKTNNFICEFNYPNTKYIDENVLKGISIKAI